MTLSRHSGMLKSLAAGAGLSLVLGCSMHPLPEDMTGVSTTDIVERIRCEVKEGLDAFLPPRRHHEAAKLIIDATSIGFEFDFIIDEQTRAAGGSLILDRRAVDTAKGVNISLTGSINGRDDNKSERSNTRVFRLFENLKDLRSAKCPIGIARANRVYPITGATGMAEVVQTYVKLEVMTDLARPEGVVFSDELKFTTAFAAGVTPDLTIDTAVGSLRIIKASITGSVKRSDYHAVTVALSRDTDDVDLPRGAQKLAQRATRSARTSARRESAKNITDKDAQTSLAKRDAGSRNRVLLELQRRRNLREDDRVVARVLTGVPP